MVKILNLDALEGTSDKTLVFKGVSHSFKPFTVDEFIAEMKRAQDQEKAGDVSVTDFVNYLVSMVVRSFPTVQEADLRELPVERLKIIADFVNGVNQEDNDEAAATAVAPVAEGSSEAKNPPGESI